VCVCVCVREREREREREKGGVGEYGRTLTMAIVSGDISHMGAHGGAVG
jgi:hypothetical protein